MKSSSKTQLTGMGILTFLLAVFLYVAISSKELVWIIVTVILSILYILFLLNSIKVIKQENGIKLKHDRNYVLAIVFVIAISFLFAFGYFLYDDIKFKKSSIKVNAIIYNVDQSNETIQKKDDNGNVYYENKKTCKNYIKYNVNGNDYDGMLENEDCKYSINDIVKIYCQQNDPVKFKSNSTLIYIVGFLSCLFFFIFLIYTVRKGSKKERNKNHGNI